MKSIRNLGRFPAGFPLSADDVVELHASRVLLLLYACGTHNRIDGLTKLAKLDFFVRYPMFFIQVAEQLHRQVIMTTPSVESPMVRHHYGPWDKRYYHVLAYLESRGLVTIRKQARMFTFHLTDLGISVSSKLAIHPAFDEQVKQMRTVKSVLGARTGSSLKKLIYSTFEKQIANKPLGEVIVE